MREKRRDDKDYRESEKEKAHEQYKNECEIFTEREKRSHAGHAKNINPKKPYLEGSMFTNVRNIAVLAFLVFAAPLAKADFSVPSHSCSKPGKAVEVKSQNDAEKFNEAVSKYKSCIQGFVQQQEDAIANHQRAASQAIAEWNEFVANDMKR